MHMWIKKVQIKWKGKHEIQIEHLWDIYEYS